MMKKLTIILIVLFTLSTPLQNWAQQHLQNTLTFDESKESPKANIYDLAWLQGHWKGEAFGGITEEIWTPPLGGSMMGAFKLVSDGQVSFYEIETISEENNTLVLRLKHFNSDLTGWEEKEEKEEFKLVKITPNKVFFDGFTVEKISETEINMYVVIGSEEGAEEVKFNYHKQ